MINVNAIYEQFQHDTSVQFNSCTMLIVEKMSKNSLTIIMQCVNKIKFYFNFHINNSKLLKNKIRWILM
jgi:hypothetical protein